MVRRQNNNFILENEEIQEVNEEDMLSENFRSAEISAPTNEEST